MGKCWWYDGDEPSGGFWGVFDVFLGASECFTDLSDAGGADDGGVGIVVVWGGMKCRGVSGRVVETLGLVFGINPGFLN